MEKRYRRLTGRVGQYFHQNSPQNGSNTGPDQDCDDDCDDNCDDVYEVARQSVQELDVDLKNEETFGPLSDMPLIDYAGQPPVGQPPSPTEPPGFGGVGGLIGGDPRAVGSRRQSWNSPPKNERPALRPILKTSPQYELIHTSAPGGSTTFGLPNRVPSGKTGSQWYDQYVKETQNFDQNNKPWPIKPWLKKVHFSDEEEETTPPDKNENSYGLGFWEPMRKSLPSFPINGLPISESFGLKPLLDDQMENGSDRRPFFGDDRQSDRYHYQDENRENTPPPGYPIFNRYFNGFQEIYNTSRKVFKQENDYLASKWNSNAEKFKNWNGGLNPVVNDPIWAASTTTANAFFKLLNLPESVPNKVHQLFTDFQKTIPKTPANYTWSGQLPRKSRSKTPVYSCKVFLGGIPYDLTDSDLHCTFAQFGHIQIQWPGKDIKSAIDGAAANKAGYVYIIFECYDNVAALLSACTVSYRDMESGARWYFNINSRRQKGKEVQVIPFDIGDRFYMKTGFSGQMEHSRTVFVGALHGMLSADGLAKVMDDLFGGVVFAGLDTDKYKYPLGSGRVSFDNHDSYMKAITAAFVEIKSARFKKKIQIDPYIESETTCNICRIQQNSPIFCRDEFLYFCGQCWEYHHSDPESSRHRPIIKNKPSNNA